MIPQNISTNNKSRLTRRHAIKPVQVDELVPRQLVPFTTNLSNLKIHEEKGC